MMLCPDDIKSALHKSELRLNYIVPDCGYGDVTSFHNENGHIMPF